MEALGFFLQPEIQISDEHGTYECMASVVRLMALSLAVCTILYSRMCSVQATPDKATKQLRRVLTDVLLTSY